MIVSKPVDGGTDGKGRLVPAETVRPLLVCAIAVLAFVCYANTLSMGFVNWDDNKLIVNNAYIRSLSRDNLKDIWTKPILETYLPLRVTSYAIDYHFWGLDPKGYHLTNVLLNVVNSLFVFFICARLSGSYVAGAIAGALFAVHPVHSEPVAWASGRKDVLSTAFFLLAYLLYLVSADRGRWKWPWVVASLIAFLLSGLAKAMVVTLPLLVVLTDVIFGGAFEEQRWRRFVPHWVAYFAVAAVLGAVAVTTAASAGAIRPYHFGGPAKTALFMCWAALNYLKTMVFPDFLSARYPYGDTGDFGVSKALVEVSPFVLLAVLAAVAVLVWRSAQRREAQAPAWVKLTALGAAWFFVTLLPVMNMVSINVLVADRYLYLPSVGFLMAAAGALWFLWGETGDSRRETVAITCVLLIVAGAARTFTRNEVWRDSYSLWSSVVYEFPASVEARLQLASAYADTVPPDYDKALGQLDTAQKLDANSGGVHLARGKLFSRMGKPADAAAELELARKSGLPGVADVYDAYLSEAGILEAQGRIPEAAEAVERALRADPGRPEAYNNLGLLKERLGDKKGARKCYEGALKADARFAHAWYNLGVLAAGEQDNSAAMGYYKKAADADPLFAEARVNLAALYLDAGDAKTAKGLLEYAIKVNPQLVPAHVNLARAYVMEGDLESAREELRKAVKLDPENKAIKEFLNKFDAMTKGVGNASQ